MIALAVTYLPNSCAYVLCLLDCRSRRRQCRCPEWCSASLVCRDSPPFRQDSGSLHAHRVGPACSGGRLRQTRRGRGRRSARGSAGWQRRLSLPCLGCASAACHERLTSAGGGRTSSTVVFPIPRHTLQVARLRRRGSSTRSDHDELVG